MKRSSQKKGKDTETAPLNQMQNTTNPSILKRRSATLIDKLLIHLQKNIPYLIDENLIRQHYSYVNQLKHIKLTVLTDPRYPHQIVQKKLDNLFLRDNQIKGASVDFIFRELKNNPENFNPNVRGLF